MEHDLAKVGAAGSSPVSRSKKGYPIGYPFLLINVYYIHILKISPDIHLSGNRIGDRLIFYMENANSQTAIFRIHKFIRYHLLQISSIILFYTVTILHTINPLQRFINSFLGYRSVLDSLQNSIICCLEILRHQQHICSCLNCHYGCLFRSV